MRKMSNSFKIILLLTLVVGIKSCNTTSTLINKDIEGVYKLNEMENIELRINGQGFSLVDTNNIEHQRLYKCCDTIAFGNWNIENSEFISISSPEILDNYVDMYIEESEDNLPKNHFMFVIVNPVESHYQKFDEDYRELYYDINISVGNDFVDKKMDTNKQSFKLDDKITEFEIVIKIKSDIPLRESLKEVYTLSYRVKNTKSNLFKINIPELNYGFLSYKRLNSDYIKILNKNELIWDGKRYIRK